MAGIPDMVKLVADLATYKAAVAAGKTSPDVMYLILAEKKVFFQGEDWTELDTSSLATKADLEEAEEVTAYVFNKMHADLSEGELVITQALVNLDTRLRKMENDI